MRLLRDKLMLLSTLLFVATPLLAVEPDQIRGRVLNVAEDSRMLTLRVLETGDLVDQQVDVVRSYTIPENADIEANLRTDILDNELGEIEETEIVTIEIDVDEPGNARNVRYERAGDA